MTVNYSSSVAEAMLRYAAIVKKIDVQIEGIADQIRVTSSTISDIRKVFKEFAKQGGRLRRKPLPKVKDLYDDIRSCTVVFDCINHEIYAAVKDLPSPSIGKEKRVKEGLAPDKLAELEARIGNADRRIQLYQWKFGIKLSTFAMRLNNQ